MKDPLSDLLAVLEIEGMLSAQVDLRGPWAFRYPAYRHMKFGGIAQGERWVWVEGGEPVRMAPGDFYLLTDGRPYCMASDPALPSVDGVAALASVRKSTGVMRFGEGEPHSRAAAGRFVFADDDMAHLLQFLPPLIHVPAHHSGSVHLASLLPLILAETEQVRPGALVAASSLASLVLVHIIRAHLADKPPPSWLAAMGDPYIGAALSLMHGQVERAWTVRSLAFEVGMSRTAFAVRFRDRVGVAPLAYLLGWRMERAKAALRAGEPDIKVLAEQMGYGSSTAFSIAFKREVGRSPSEFRDMHRRPLPSA